MTNELLVKLKEMTERRERLKRSRRNLNMVARIYMIGKIDGHVIYENTNGEIKCFDPDGELYVKKYMDKINNKNTDETKMNNIKNEVKTQKPNVNDAPKKTNTFDRAKADAEAFNNPASPTHNYTSYDGPHKCGCNDDLNTQDVLNWESTMYNALGFPGHNPINVKFETEPDSFVVPKNTARIIMIDNKLVCLDSRNNLIYGDAMIADIISKNFASCVNITSKSKCLKHERDSKHTLYKYDSDLYSKEEYKRILINPKLRSIVKFRLCDEWEWCVIEYKNNAISCVKFASNYLAAKYYMEEIAAHDIKIDEPVMDAFPVGNFFDFNKNDWTEYDEYNLESREEEKYETVENAEENTEQNS